MVPYLSDKILEAAFHGQAVKTVAYLRVSTAQDAAAHFDGLLRGIHHLHLLRRKGSLDEGSGWLP